MGLSAPEEAGPPEPAEPTGRLALVDTSVFIAQEQQRPISNVLPARLALSAVTLGELRQGVLAAPDSPSRITRLRTLRKAELLSPIPIDDDVADAWAALRVVLVDEGRRLPINDSWIAATAIAHGLPLVTQDADFVDVPGLRVLLI